MRLVLRKVDLGHGLLAFEVTERQERAIETILGGATMVHISLSKNDGKRTTGPQSQNRRINGHIHIIANELGYEFEEMKLILKRMAVSRGYPLMLRDNELVFGEDGLVMPESERDVTREQATALIETINQFAAEQGILLPE